MATCVTDSTGKCSFSNVPAGRYTVTTNKQPYNTSSFMIDVTGNQTFTVELAMPAAPGYTVTIQVRDQSTGAVIPSATVDLV